MEINALKDTKYLLMYLFPLISISDSICSEFGKSWKKWVKMAFFSSQLLSPLILFLQTSPRTLTMARVISLQIYHHYSLSLLLYASAKLELSYRCIARFWGLCGWNLSMSPKSISVLPVCGENTMINSAVHDQYFLLMYIYW